MSSGSRSASIPASTLHPITDVAKPVMDCAAVRAHVEDCAVIITRRAGASRPLPPPEDALLRPVERRALWVGINKDNLFSFHRPLTGEM